jgi:UDP-3-O-[3-hydroxymyristoyl] glucosamine N-acyltransferase
MSDLTNNLINATYKKLLQVSTSGNTGISGTLTNVQTGDGTNTAVKIATSAVQVDGTLFVGQTFGVSGDASIAGNLAISNKVCASAFHGDGSNLTGLVFTGDVSVSSLIVTNNVTVGGNVTIGGNIMVSGGEVVVKNTGTQSNIKLYCESSNAHYAALQAPPHSSFSGNITITLPTSAATLVGTSTTDTLTNKTFGDAVTFDDDISVSGNSNFGGTVTVAGATSLASTLAVGGAATFESTTTVSGTAGFLGAVRVSGNTSVGGTLDVAGNVSLGGNVTVKGDVHVSSKVCASAFYGDGTNITGIPITGNISVSNANVGGTLFVSSTATIKGATSLASTLSVGGAVNLASTLTVASNISVGGTSNITGKAEFEDDVSVSGNTAIGGTLDVAGNVSLGGNVTVKGDVHVSSKVCASAFFGDGSNLSNITAVVQGNISVNNATIGGNLFVGGTATVVGNATFDGDISVSGDINVGGHVTIAGAVQLGSTLSVTGYSHFKDDVSVSGNAIVGGTVSVGGGIIDLKNTGSQSELRMYCESSNAHYAALKAPAHSAFSGNIALVMPAVDDTLVGEAATQTLTNKTFGDKVDFDNDVCISGDAFIGGTATIAGNASVGGTLTVGGKAEFDGAVCISGNTEVVGNLAVGGTATVAGNASIGGTVSVGGAVNLLSTVTVSGAAGFLTTARVSGNTTIGGTLDVAGNTSIGGTSNITGKAEFEDDVSVSGNVVIGGTTTITGNSGFLGTIRVSGNTSLEGQLQLTKSAAAVVCATAINGVASVSLNFGNAQNFSTTVTAAHTLAKPIGCRTGQTGSIFLTQSGGSGTMAYNADFKFIGGTDPTLSTDNGAVDRLDYIVVSASSDGVGGDIQMVISQAYA